MQEVRVSDLAVRGTKLPIYDPQHLTGRSRIRHNNLNDFRVSEIRPQTVDSDQRKTGDSKHAYREVFKLKTARISGSAVETKQLREIRESVDIEDLRRLLRLLGDHGSGDEGSGKLVTSVDVGKIYRDFYKVHYDFIRDVCGDTS